MLEQENFLGVNVSPDEKKKEAVQRMRMLGIYGPIIRAFQGGTISESVPPLGACFYLNDEQMERVHEFEEEHNAMVYHVIHSVATDGFDKIELENYLYVSDHPEEWEDDREDLRNKLAFVYVYNKTDPDLSEFGTIAFYRTVAAGLMRKFGRLSL